MTSPRTPLGGAFYLAASGFERELQDELHGEGSKVGPSGRLFHLARPHHHVAWAANCWRNPVRIDATSASKAASLLRAEGRGKCDEWVFFGEPTEKALAITALLPKTRRGPLPFPPTLPMKRPGSWTLVSDTEIIASPECESPFPNGEALFVEDHKNPPSRAYRKLWEALILAGVLPQPGERCVDLGSAPGGWTWALERLGARVTSVDKAKLAPSLMELTRIRHIEESAFAIEPSKVGKVEWVLSDVICYPDRAIRLIERWLAVFPHAGFIITIKLQGDAHDDVFRALFAIPGGRLVHLHHNRHELTWIRPPRAPKPDAEEG